ncbi:MAG: hypothetical protein AB2551_12480 [Candidatus Thiodiazotropha sp.]
MADPRRVVHDAKRPQGFDQQDVAGVVVTVQVDPAYRPGCFEQHLVLIRQLCAQRGVGFQQVRRDVGLPQNEISRALAEGVDTKSNLLLESHFKILYDDTTSVWPVILLQNLNIHFIRKHPNV